MTETSSDTNKDETVGYVRKIETVIDRNYAKRFKVTISTPLPDLLLKHLKEYLPEVETQKASLLDLLESLFDYQKMDTPETEEWFLYPPKESAPPKDDRILRAINIVRKKHHKSELTWTHLTLFVASKTENTNTTDVEHMISSWIEDVMPPQKDGDLITWITAIPIKLLPDEYIKKGKRIPLPRSVFERILKKIETNPEHKKDERPSE